MFGFHSVLMVVSPTSLLLLWLHTALLLPLASSQLCSFAPSAGGFYPTVLDNVTQVYPTPNTRTVIDTLSVYNGASSAQITALSVKLCADPADDYHQLVVLALYDLSTNRLVGYTLEASSLQTYVQDSCWTQTIPLYTAPITLSPNTAYNYYIVATSNQTIYIASRPSSNSIRQWASTWGVLFDPVPPSSDWYSGSASGDLSMAAIICPTAPSAVQTPVQCRSSSSQVVATQAYTNFATDGYLASTWSLLMQDVSLPASSSPIYVWALTVRLRTGLLTLGYNLRMAVYSTGGALLGQTALVTSMEPQGLLNMSLFTPLAVAASSTPTVFTVAVWGDSLSEVLANVTSTSVVRYLFTNLESNGYPSTLPTTSTSIRGQLAVGLVTCSAPPPSSSSTGSAIVVATSARRVSSSSAASTASALPGGGGSSSSWADIRCDNGITAVPTGSVLMSIPLSSGGQLGCAPMLFFFEELLGASDGGGQVGTEVIENGATLEVTLITSLSAPVFELAGALVELLLNSSSPLYVDMQLLGYTVDTHGVFDIFTVCNDHTLSRTWCNSGSYTPGQCAVPHPAQSLDTSAQSGAVLTSIRLQVDVTQVPNTFQTDVPILLTDLLNLPAGSIAVVGIPTPLPTLYTSTDGATSGVSFLSLLFLNDAGAGFDAQSGYSALQMSLAALSSAIIDVLPLQGYPVSYPQQLAAQITVCGDGTLSCSGCGAASTSSSSGLSGGAIAGIVVGGVVVLLLVVCVVTLLCLRARKEDRPSSPSTPSMSSRKTPSNTTAPTLPVRVSPMAGHRRSTELEGETITDPYAECHTSVQMV